MPAKRRKGPVVSMTRRQDHSSDIGLRKTHVAWQDPTHWHLPWESRTLLPWLLPIPMPCFDFAMYVFGLPQDISFRPRLSSQSWLRHLPPIRRFGPGDPCSSSLAPGRSHLLVPDARSGLLSDKRADDMLIARPPFCVPAHFGPIPLFYFSGSVPLGIPALSLSRSFPLPLHPSYFCTVVPTLHLVPIGPCRRRRDSHDSWLQPGGAVASDHRPPEHTATMNRSSADWSCATVTETSTLPGSPRVESHQSEPPAVEVKGGGDEEEAGIRPEGSRCWSFWGSDGPSIFKLLMVFSALAMVLSILFQVIQFFLQYFKQM
ncbi:hypothetical protein B0H67DRAFT_342138 [Lasiosphaeris hirsuta]|uniref:Uncharacterized protein n=1 Tax=Lasiosphaeris hirsuta TaxID=260670 RepID=A0AA40DQP2_9PEZI|nr:hypothetical protein B0H67DRAFT_342138 [Lasiosphaeris hirsuta]